jgi:hypothetical protein
MLKISDFRNQMKLAGIANPKRYIDTQISRILHAVHQDIHEAKWNEAWINWLDKNRTLQLETYRCKQRK